ncbi:MAG: DNA polymerase I [Ignavibacteria bacterium]|nr:DNA polymerase I [Ignavibacteria bacterium]
MGPLILVDGFSLVFRAYHALRNSGMESANGEPTFAVFAFANILTSLLDKHHPDAIAVVFDTATPTFRHELYDQYKANRDAFPEDLVPQLARIKQLISLMGLEQVEMPGYEADDIIGTIAARESQDGHEILCLTSDKDYFQLVTDKVKVLRPGKDINTYETYDPDLVKERFGVPPGKVIDVLALMGDSVDNVPGVKGVGEKTAKPLVEQFGSIENIYVNIDNIEKVSLRKKLEESKDLAFLSKKLVTIHRDVPINAKRVMLERKPMDYAAIDELCAELGFTTLRNKFRKYAESAGVELETILNDSKGAGSGESDGLSETQISRQADKLKTISDVNHTYVLVDTPGGLDELVNELKNVKELSVDLETTGLDAMQCSIVGISLCAKEGHAFYIDVDDPIETPTGALFTSGSERHGLDVQLVIESLKPLLHNQSISKIGQNLKFDALILKRYGIDVQPIAFDTMLASFILDPDRHHSLDALAERWLSYKTVPITDLIGEKRGQQKSMKDVDLQLITEYAGEDSDVALKLKHMMYAVLKREKLLELAETVEFPLERVLVTMEFNGVRIDSNALGDLADFMRKEAARLEKEVWKEAGEEFTIGSPKQLAEVLFEKMMLPAGRKTKTGYSTDSGVLSELAESFPIAQMVLDYRQVEKLRSTYVEALPRLINPRTGRVHTTYNQTVAATGRLSSTDPNLQNIPIRTELGQRIRKAFVAQASDAVIMSADYSQIELRIMAGISQDENLIAAFNDGADIHKSTAAILFGVSTDKVTSEQRRIAKTTNFGIMYGQGAFGLSQQLGISRSEGQQIIANYFEKYPGIKRYMDETVRLTRERGFATTLLGRRRYFPQISSSNRQLQAAAERAAVNTPIQGTAADMMKKAMISIHTRMEKEGFNSLMMLQVHDELVFEAKKSEVKELQKLVTDEMEHALPLKGVPIVVETGVGESWYEAH